MKSKKWLISLCLAVVLVVAFALPACEGGGVGEPATRLNIGVSALPNNLYMDQEDLTATNAGCLYLMLVYENLAGYPKVDAASLEANPRAAYEFVPKLAKNLSWSYEPDGTGGLTQVLTINLREGVKWHDGEDFTADDVVFSVQHVISPWNWNKPVNWTWVYDPAYPWCDDDICTEDILVKATGPLQVQFRYVQDYHQPEEYFPIDFMWYGIVPKHVFGPAGNGTYEGWQEDPLDWDGNYIGTGPYKVKEYVVDSHILLERNEEYWAEGDEGDPYWELPAAQEVLFKLYEDEGAFWLAFRSDTTASLMDSSAAFSVPFVAKEDLEADERVTVEVVPDLSIYYLGFNLHETAGYPPLQALPLREAIAAAIDKQGIVDMVLGGYGGPVDSFVYLESPNHNDDLPNNEYNPTTAANILTTANYTKESDGFWYTPESEKIEFSIGAAPGYTDVAMMIIEDLQDFGLDVSLQALDSSTYYDYLYHPDLGGMMAFISAEDPSPDPWGDWIWCMLADPEDWGWEWNPCWYYDSEYNELYKENYLATTPEAKKVILLRMQEILAEDLPMVFLVREDVIAACRTDRWDNWFNEIGSYATWINEYSIREVTPVG